MIPSSRATIYAIIIFDLAILIGFLQVKENKKIEQLINFTQEKCVTYPTIQNSDLCEFLIKAYL
tara:strand:- start:1421 stop:1612 length:192 start_codon:yes stop_codon:yes gene_type:complete